MRMSLEHIMILEHGPPTLTILRREDALRDGLERLLVGMTTVGLVL